MTAGATPDRILKELSDYWTSVAREGKHDGESGVLRACSMTLVVLTDEADDPMPLGETLAALMPEHPARAIVMRLRAESGTPLEAGVSSQCWMPFGTRRQICSEQIVIAASDDALPDLAPFVLALTAPDLPVLLWCRSARLVERTDFWDFAKLARKVILDSAQLGDPQTAIARVAQAVRAGFLVGDLAWSRLTRWRETLAQVFDTPRHRELLPKVTVARVQYPPGRETSAHYARTWLDNALKAAGAKATVELSQGEAPTVELTGEELQIQQTVADGRLVVTVNGLSRCTNYPQPTEYLTVREELPILRRDPVFEAVLP